MGRFDLIEVTTWASLTVLLLFFLQIQEQLEEILEENLPSWETHGVLMVKICYYIS